MSVDPRAGEVRLELDPESGMERLAVPTLPMVVINESRGSWQLDGSPFRALPTNEKGMMLMDVVVLQPGMALTVKSQRSLHGTIKLEVKESYAPEVIKWLQKPATARWVGQMEVRL